MSKTKGLSWIYLLTKTNDGCAMGETSKWIFTHLVGVISTKEAFLFWTVGPAIPNGDELKKKYSLWSVRGDAWSYKRSWN